MFHHNSSTRTYLIPQGHKKSLLHPFPGIIISVLHSYTSLCTWKRWRRGCCFLAKPEKHIQTVVLVCLICEGARGRYQRSPCVENSSGSYSNLPSVRGRTWIAGSEEQVRKKCDLLGLDLAWQNLLRQSRGTGDAAAVCEQIPEGAAFLLGLRWDRQLDSWGSCCSPLSSTFRMSSDRPEL